MDSEVLSCGCEKILINGKVHWVFCDEHDEDGFEEINTSRKQFKMFFNKE